MKLPDRTHTLSQYFTLESLDTIGQSGFDGDLALELDTQDGETITVDTENCLRDILNDAANSRTGATQ